jgi:hypothetical protein
MLDWIAAIRFFIKGDFGNFSAVIKSHGHFILSLPTNLKKRRSLERQYPFYNGRLIYSGSIVKDYFIKGKKSVEL